MNKKRRSLQLQLDIENDDELEIFEYASEKKEKRQFSKTAKTALRLIASLEDGKLDVLEEEFPWIFESKSGSKDGGGGIPHDQMEPFIQQIVDALGMKMSAGNTEIVPTSKGSMNFTPPANDVDLPEIKTTKKILTPEEQLEKDYQDGKVGHWNLLIQMNIGLDGDTRSLPLEVVEYGIQRPTHTGPGPIPESQIADKHRHLLAGGKPDNKPKKSGGPKKMDIPDITFTPPPDDDLPEINF